MIGKIRQKLISQAPRVISNTQAIICPICDRSIPASQKDAHHLIPKSKGGRTTEFLHRICHRQIHALFTETELANQFNNAAALQDRHHVDAVAHAGALHQQHRTLPTQPGTGGQRHTFLLRGEQLGRWLIAGALDVKTIEVEAIEFLHRLQVQTSLVYRIRRAMPIQRKLKDYLNALNLLLAIKQALPICITPVA